MLQTGRENQIASIDWPPHRSDSTREVEAHASLLVRTK